MSDDPVLAKRARIAHWVSLGQRVGYGLFGLACVAFVAGFVVGFEDWLTTLIVAALVVGSLVLAPAIVFGYGVRAADRADREAPGTDAQPIVRLTWSTARSTAAVADGARAPIWKKPWIMPGFSSSSTSTPSSARRAA